MKVKLFRSGSRDARYSTIRIPSILADKYCLNENCTVDVIDSEENHCLIIKKSS